MSYTIKLKTASIQMGKTFVVNQTTNPTANNSSDFNLESLNISTNLNLKYCNGVVGLLHTDVAGNVTTRLIDTADFNPLSVTSSKLAASIFLSGIPTATTASQDTNTTQIATTEFVKTACSSIIGLELVETLNSLKELADAIGNDPLFSTNIITSVNSKVSLAANDNITGVKTFNTLPVLTPLNSVGIVHNNASGNLSTSLIQTADIADSAVTTAKINNAAVTFEKLDSNLANSFNLFTDNFTNKQPVSPIIFFHVNNSNISVDVDGIKVFTLSNNIRHVIDVAAKIILPAIAVEGIFYSIVNKSDDNITISTAFLTEYIFNNSLAPNGDNDFFLGVHQGLEFISIISNGVASWQACYC
jgi:hypothetical protein